MNPVRGSSYNNIGKVVIGGNNATNSVSIKNNTALRFINDTTWLLTPSNLHQAMLSYTQSHSGVTNYDGRSIVVNNAMTDTIGV